MDVTFSPEARADLIALYDYIADQASPVAALNYIERIEASCLTLSSAPHRGTQRDDIRPGLRTFGFERRVTIAFHIQADTVMIDRILYGGRDLPAALGSEAKP